MNRPLALLLIACLAAGCTATKASVNLVLADQAVDRAQEANAPELAVYEYTMAIRYLEKAREEAGYADYKASETLAQKAAEYADQSIIAIQRGGRDLNVDEAGDDLTDEPTRLPPDPPPPAKGGNDLLDSEDEP